MNSVSDPGDVFFIKRAHELADVLQLTSSAFVVFDAAAFGNGILQIIWYADAADTLGRCIDQLLTKFLQCGHFAFALRFGRAVVFFPEFFGLETAVASVGIWHNRTSV